MSSGLLSASTSIVTEPASTGSKPWLVVAKRRRVGGGRGAVARAAAVEVAGGEVARGVEGRAGAGAGEVVEGGSGARPGGAVAAHQPSARRRRAATWNRRRFIG